jgi:hypothetical protein
LLTQAPCVSAKQLNKIRRNIPLIFASLQFNEKDSFYPNTAESKKTNKAIVMKQ